MLCFRPRWNISAAAGGLYPAYLTKLSAAIDDSTAVTVRAAAIAIRGVFTQLRRACVAAACTGSTLAVLAAKICEISGVSRRIAGFQKS